MNLSDPRGEKNIRELVISVTANFTAEPIRDYLEFWIAHLGLETARLEFSAYNQVFQELASPNSLLSSNVPGVNLVLVRLEDWARDQEAHLRTPTVASAAHEFIAAMQNFSRKGVRPTVLLVCPPSTASEKDPNFSRTNQELIAQVIRETQKLPGITAAGPAEIFELYPVQNFEDPESNRQAHIPFTAQFWASLGTFLARKLRICLAPPCKVIVVDADNTLWGGVVGEVGAGNVQLDSDRLALQAFLRSQKNHGRLLALVSKNRESDASEVFRSRREMVLQRDDFVDWKVNWEPKSKNIQTIAKELNLGLGSFVFLDDNPMECAEVRAHCPEVMTLLLPADSAQIPEFLKHLWVFDQGKTSAVDDQRTAMYRQQLQRNQLRNTTSNFREFIDGLLLEVSIESLTQKSVDRAAQLSQRTNQFNTSGIRRTASEMAAILGSHSHCALMIRARDRFGDYGEVGLAVFKTGDGLLVEDFLMSCRALGKGIEHRLLNKLGSEARQRGLFDLNFVFQNTERNLPARNFLEAIGAVSTENRYYRIAAAFAETVTFDPEREAGFESLADASEPRAGSLTAIADFQSIASELTSPDDIVRHVRARLRRNRPNLESRFVAPRNSRESTLAAIWQEVLNIYPIGVEDSFFLLGGQSLQAASISARVVNEFGVRIQIGNVLSHPTIAEFDRNVLSSARNEKPPQLSKAIGVSPSPAQQRLWFLDQFIPNRAAYNIPVAFRVRGLLNVDALHSALLLVVSRHQALRTTFPMKDGAPRPVVSESPVAEFRSVRAASWDDARLLANLEARQTFDLAVGPLQRCLVLAIAPDDHLVSLTTHHIVSDGISTGVILRDLANAYAAILARREPTWLPIQAEYSDYAEWQNQRLSTDALSSDLGYWKKELSGAPLLLDLPTDTPRPAAMTYKGSCVRASLSTQLRKSMESLAQSEQTTPFAILLAVWQTLLFRYSRQDDIVVGVPVAGRLLESVESLVGCCVNTLAMRTVVDGQASFRNHLRLTREKLHANLTHQELPLEHLVNELALGRDLSRTPLFQSVVVQQEPFVSDFAGSGLSVTAVPVHNGGAKFDLVLEATPAGEGYDLMLEFNSDLFLPQTAERMLSHCINLLQHACRQPETQLLSIPIMEKNEVIEILNLVNREPLGFDNLRCLHREFERRVEKAPTAPALTFELEALSYQDLNQRANRIANHLIAQGVKPGQLVGICLHRSSNLVAAILGVLKAGAAYLPIDLSYPADRIAFMLADAQAAALLTESNLVGSLPKNQVGVICLDETEQFPRQPTTNPELSVSLDDLAYVIYTSGSTGKPKGCMVTHRNVARLMRATEHWFAFDDRDVWTLFHSAAFDFSVWEIWGALLYGGRLVVVPFLVSRSPEAFYDLLVKEKVTVLNQTPSAFRQLIQVEESGVSAALALRYIIFGGEALEMQSLRPWFERHVDQTPQLINMYGITETTVHVTYRPLTKDDLDAGSVIGIPIPDLQMYILDSLAQPVPIGVPGEMYIGGAGLARGYLHRPELTEQRFIPDHLTGKKGARLYRTGDLARFLPGGDIEYLGRIDEQVKIRGFRIELGEIESVLCQHSSIREASVMARSDVPGAKHLVAYVVSNGPRPELNDLREHLKKRLPEYMVPAAIVFMGALPLTSNGKIDRKALPAPELDRPELGKRYVAPSTSNEEKLSKIWSKVLRVERVGVDDNFFELGGDSILSIQIIALARREGLKLTPKLLFENQTVRELSQLAGLATSTAAAKQGPVAGEFPLTPIQHWFFEQDLVDAHHYNQSFQLEVSGRLDRQILQSALQAVGIHHEALSLRFKREEHSWRQSYANGDQSVPLEVAELENLSPDDELERIEAVARIAQAGLNFQDGPTWRVIYFDRGADRDSRLLVVVHHLAVDGVSWRPLLEDIEAAYTQLAQNLPVQLPPKSTSFSEWSEKLKRFAVSDSLQEELPYWKDRIDPKLLAASCNFLHAKLPDRSDYEGDARTLVTSLNQEETQQLLQQLPQAYHTQINDALLTALAEAWRIWTGGLPLITNLEGHGREDFFEDVDLSRTVGWFTSIFPVQVDLADLSFASQPGAALRFVKEQLGKVPRRGIGYGMLRYLAGKPELLENPDPPMVFNYLGQFDQVIANSELFRPSGDFSGLWHSPRQRRRHALEVNCLVVDGRLNVRWTYNPELTSESSLQALGDEFIHALRLLISDCLQRCPGVRTSDDFPLVHLEAAVLNGLLAEHPQLEDLYPLSPVQALYFSANPTRMLTGFDQWHCSLSGPLDVPAFQNAWRQTINRHSVLRSSVQIDGLQEPLQMVAKQVDLPWTVEDWSALPTESTDRAWLEFLSRDRARPLDLTKAPVMRFALIRQAENRWKFLWSLPALFLDGWSWPIVFKDASRIYESFQGNTEPNLQPAPPYRNYLQWLRQQSPESSKQFWREMLSDFAAPTALPTERQTVAETAGRFASFQVPVRGQTAVGLQAAARRLHLTLNSLVQGAWALLLARQSKSSSVVFGSAFSGRPANLESSEFIVGPFVNVLPVRADIKPLDPAADFFRQLHTRLLGLSLHQFAPLSEIQRYSKVPERFRLFDSLIVFQNYRIDGASEAFGGQLQISDFVGPVHTNYPWLLLVEPHAGLRLTMIYDMRLFTLATVERWAQDIANLLDNLVSGLDQSVSALLNLLSVPAMTAHHATRQLEKPRQNLVPAQSPNERAIAAIWAEMFGLDHVSVEETFFDLGGHSLLLVRMHRRLQEAGWPDLSIVTLFEHPTVRALARHLDRAGEPSPALASGDSRNRAVQQKNALQQMRARLKKSD